MCFVLIFGGRAKLHWCWLPSDHAKLWPNIKTSAVTVGAVRAESRCQSCCLRQWRLPALQSVSQSQQESNNELKLPPSLLSITMKLLPLFAFALVGRSLCEPGQCEEISIPMCKEIGYNFTRLPNQFNHESQDEVSNEQLLGVTVGGFFGLINKENDKQRRDTAAVNLPI